VSALLDIAQPLSNPEGDNRQPVAAASQSPGPQAREAADIGLWCDPRQLGPRPGATPLEHDRPGDCCVEPKPSPPAQLSVRRSPRRAGPAWALASRCLRAVCMALRSAARMGPLGRWHRVARVPFAWQCALPLALCVYHRTTASRLVLARCCARCLSRACMLAVLARLCAPRARASSSHALAPSIKDA
jgi:hypothetical protein